MKLDGARIILTGATGGIGSEVVRQLKGRGAHIALLGRNSEALETLAAEFGGVRAGIFPIAAELLEPDGCTAAIDQALERLGGVDVLINNAGLLSFRPFAEEDPAVLERIVRLKKRTPSVR